LERFVAVRGRLRGCGFSTRFLLGPAESGFKEALREYSEEIVRPENLVELAERLPSAGGLIGNDSGVSHLAAFLGVPTAAVFGPSDPVRWRPVGADVAVVSPRDEECASCFEEPDRPDCAERPCLGTISAQSVAEAFLALNFERI
jgi:ADP-heptose:LPS heptosyltransferase